MKLSNSESSWPWDHQQTANPFEEFNHHNSTISLTPKSQRTKTSINQSLKTNISKSLQGVRWGRLVTALAAGASVIILSMTVWLLSSQFKSEVAENPVVYVEIKAVTEMGSPIAGATVAINEQNVGITDAFGEWRRYLHLQPDIKLNVLVSKDLAVGRLSGTRTLIFKKAELDSEDFTLKANIKLQTSSKIDKAKAFLQSAANKNSSFSTLQPKPDLYRNIELELSPGPDTKDPYSLQYYNRLKDQVLPEIRKSLLSSGLIVGKSRDLKLKIDYVPTDGKSGIIRNSVEWLSEGAWKKTSFLRNFAINDHQTAVEILNISRAYIPQKYLAYKDQKGWFLYPHTATKFWQLNEDSLVSDGVNTYPLYMDQKAGRLGAVFGNEPLCQGLGALCDVVRKTISDSPPTSGWQQLKLKVTSKIPKDHNLYVAGFLANNLGNGLWQYWGPPGKKVNVTILKDHKGLSLVGRYSILARADSTEILIIENNRVASR